jgi:hypothetical protein
MILNLITVSIFWYVAQNYLHLKIFWMATKTNLPGENAHNIEDGKK